MLNKDSKRSFELFPNNESYRLKWLENQIEFEKAISIFDYQYCVIYSFDDFVHTIESYLNIIK